MASRVRAAPDPTQRWRSLHATHERVLYVLDRELQRQHHISACELDVLQRIADHDHDPRIQDLSEQVLRSHSAISRMVDRLENDKLVTRTDYSGDRRGVAVRLTDTGLERLTAAQDTQRRVLTEHLPPA